MTLLRPVLLLLLSYLSAVQPIDSKIGDIQNFFSDWVAG